MSKRQNVADSPSANKLQPSGALIPHRQLHKVVSLISKCRVLQESSSPRSGGPTNSHSQTQHLLPHQPYSAADGISGGNLTFTDENNIGIVDKSLGDKIATLTSTDLGGRISNICRY